MMLRAALLLLAVTFALRGETLFHPLILPADEGSYFRLVYQWLIEHKPLYTGTYDHKPPGIYYLYGLLMALGGPTMLPVRIGAIVFSWIGALACHGFGRRLANARPEMAGLAAGLAYAILSCRLTGLNANLEIFFNPLIVACLWLVWEAARPGRPVWWLGVAGVLAGKVFIIKYTCGAEVVALPLAWWAWQRAGGRWQGFISRPVLTGVGLFTLGFLAPIGLTCLQLTLGGPGVGYVADRTILRNLSHKAGAAELYKPLAYVYFTGKALAEFALAWLALAAFAWRWKSWPGATVALLLGWVGASLVSATFTGHLFDHYLIECLPPLCLMAGLCLERLVEAAALQTRGAAALLLALLFVPLGADEARRNNADLLADVAAWRRGRHLWAGDANYQLAAYMQAHLAPGQYFFAVEGNPTVYVMSGRDLPTSFTYWPMLVRPHFARISGIDQGREVDRLLALPPQLIAARSTDVAGLGVPGVFPPALAAHIDSVIQERYALRDTVAGWYVWRLR